MKPTIRLLLLLLFLTGLASAQDPVLTAVGDSLDAITVRPEAAAIRTDSPRALAESYARYLTDYRKVVLHFGDLFRKVHLDVLQRYYSEELLKKQRAAYVAQPRPIACTIERVAGDRAWLLREFQGRTLRMKLKMEKRDGRWWITRIWHRKRQKYVDRGLGVPAKASAVHVPKPQAMKLSSPRETIVSLRAAMLRLRALKKRGDGRLQTASAELLTVFLGKDAVEKEQRRKARKDLPKTFRVSLPSEPIGGVVRMGVAATEPVPDVKGRTTAVGHAGFDLRRGSDQLWRVTAEFTHDQPDEPLQPLKSYFALFFLR